MPSSFSPHSLAMITMSAIVIFSPLVVSATSFTLAPTAPLPNCTSPTLAHNATLCNQEFSCAWISSTYGCRTLSFCGYTTASECSSSINCMWSAKTLSCHYDGANNGGNGYYDSNLCEMVPGVAATLSQCKTNLAPNGCVWMGSLLGCVFPCDYPDERTCGAQLNCQWNGASCLVSTGGPSTGGGSSYGTGFCQTVQGVKTKESQCAALKGCKWMGSLYGCQNPNVFCGYTTKKACVAEKKVCKWAGTRCLELNP